MKQDVVIPPKGQPKKQLLDTMQAMKSGDADFKTGRVWSLVYHGGEKHERLLKDAYNLFIAENFLNPMAFKSLKRMESEVVGMTANMLHGDTDVVGTMTSGGTESIMMAVKAARDRARAKRPWVRRPEMVVPSSIHVAFQKAAHYLNVRYVPVKVRDDFRVDVRALKRKVGHNTVLIAASAPQFPQGVIDPIEEIGAFAQAKKIPFHVDSCIGGFLLPWMEKLGHPVAPFDFRVPGVTSISADVHKYGYASKGASVIAYRNMDYLKYQFFVVTNWTGGIYASPSMPGTKPGGAIASAWASMRYMGENGFLKMAKETMAATEELIAGIAKIDGIAMLGKPDMALVAFESVDPDVDIYAVADQLAERGWHPDRQQKPNSIHVTVMAHHAPIIAEYLKDLADSVAYVKAHPGLAHEGQAAMYGMMAKIPIKGMVKLAVRKVMEGMYSPEGESPDLAKVGAGENDDPLLQMVDKYGTKAMQLIDKAELASDALKEKIEGVFHRWAKRDG